MTPESVGSNQVDRHEQRLRVLHVLTYISAVNAFGGPTSVATVLGSELQRHGHAVALLAPADAEAAGRERWLGLPSLLFPSHRFAPLGFSGIASPQALAWFWRHADDFDVIHVHMARDLTTLPVAAMALQRGKPVVLQTHGMVDPSERALSKPLDAALTRRVLRNADRILYLTDFELRGLEGVVGHDLPSAVRLTNGIKASPTPAAPAESRELLFLSRFEDRKRPDHFVRMAHGLIEEGSDLTFALVGPDQGMLAEVEGLIEELGISHRVRYEGPLPPEETAARIARARALVLPSVQEPYPMVLLEAMSLGVPVVCTTSCGLAEAVVTHGSGVVCEPTLESLIDAVRPLGEDDGLVAKLGQQAHAATQGPLGVEAVVEQLLGVYRQAIQEHA